MNRKTSKNLTPLIFALTCAMTAGIFTGCGGSAYRETPQGPVIVSGGQASGSPVSPSGSSSASVSMAPAITETFTLTGADGTTPSFSTTVNTDSILKVRVTAGSAMNLSLPEGQYSNFSATFTCVSYTVTALGQSITTKPLAADGSGGCNPYIFAYGTATAGTSDRHTDTSQILDFSSRLGAGQGPVTITVSQARYDFRCVSCMAQPWLWDPTGYYAGRPSCANYCPLNPVYKTHQLSGTLDIQVNGTSFQ